MGRRLRFGLRGVFIGVALGALSGGNPARAQWPQWGGRDRDFTVKTKGLADSWPADGPRKLWRRPLGDGYSAIVVENGVLYTMYRVGGNEFSVALDGGTGDTIWEHQNASASDPSTDGDRVCPGPNSTPLLTGSRLFTVGTDSVVHCFDKKTGRVLWKHDLIKELGGRTFSWGYAGSPIAYRNLIIAPVDRDPTPEGDDAAVPDQADGEPDARGPTLVAFDQVSGEIVWKSQDFRTDHSSPILVNVDGEDQLVLLLNRGMMGVKPGTGELLWHHELPAEHGHNMTPLWVDGNVLVAGNGQVSRAVRLTKKGGKTAAEELWTSRKIRFPQNNPVRVGDYLYGSSGSVYRSAIMLGAEIKTGKRVWAERGFALATCVHGDGKLIILDEDGKLGLATATPEGLTVHSTFRITERESWTAPTLVGTTLYVRDRKHIMALDLGEPSVPADEESSWLGKG